MVRSYSPDINRWLMLEHTITFRLHLNINNEYGQKHDLSNHVDKKDPNHRIESSLNSMHGTLQCELFHECVTMSIWLQTFNIKSEKYEFFIWLKKCLTYFPKGPKSPIMYILCTGVLMVWLFFMNSSEGSHTIKRDLGMLGSLKNRNDINLLNFMKIHEDRDKMERGMKNACWQVHLHRTSLLPPVSNIGHTFC